MGKETKTTDINLHKNDLPAGLKLAGGIAVDTETLGLNPLRDRLCLVQICDEAGACHLVQFDGTNYDAPNLKAILSDRARLKLFHYARFDVAVIAHYLHIHTSPLWCTKIASKLVRTYTDRHGLRDLCGELLGVDLSKAQQSSDWAAKELSEKQLAYAASDVLYLHELKNKLEAMLTRDERLAFAQACFDFVPIRSALDLQGFENVDIFSHN